jgi:GH15 family glucan-1,4-alpha-glucosidase
MGIDRHIWSPDAAVNVLHMIGRGQEAAELSGRLPALRNDVGLLSQEWEPRSGRRAGNTPQAGPAGRGHR